MEISQPNGQNILWFPDEYILRTDSRGMQNVLQDVRNRGFTGIAWLGSWNVDGTASIYTKWDGTNPIPTNPELIINAGHAAGLKVYFGLYADSWVQNGENWLPDMTNFPDFRSSTHRAKMIQTVTALMNKGFDGYIEDSEISGTAMGFPNEYWTGMAIYLNDLHSTLHSAGKEVGMYFPLDLQNVREDVYDTIFAGSTLDFVAFGLGLQEQNYQKAVSLGKTWLAATFACEGETLSNYADFFSVRTLPSNLHGFTLWEYYEVTSADWVSWDTLNSLQLSPTPSPTSSPSPTPIPTSTSEPPLPIETNTTLMFVGFASVVSAIFTQKKKWR